MKLAWVRKAKQKQGTVRVVAAVAVAVVVVVINDNDWLYSVPYLFMCVFRSSKANYKSSMNKDGNKHIHTNKDKRQNNATETIIKIL
jgi:hypothetical protein